MAYIDHNILRNQPNENLFASFVEGGKMSDILRKRRFGRELDAQARDFDITSPEGQVMLMQALSQVGYGREVANLQKSHFDPDSREKQRQYGRDDSMRGKIQSRIDEMMGDPMAGLELNEPPTGRFPQQQGQLQGQQPGRFQEPRSGEPGGTQDLRPEWLKGLKGLMGMFGGGQQSVSVPLPDPTQGPQRSQVLPPGFAPGGRPAPMPDLSRGYQQQAAPIHPGMPAGARPMPMPDLYQQDRTLGSQGVTGADSTELMRQATDRFLQGRQQAPAVRPAVDEDRMAWEAVKYSANPAQAYLDYQRDKMAKATKVKETDPFDDPAKYDTYLAEAQSDPEFQAIISEMATDKAKASPKLTQWALKKGYAGQKWWDREHGNLAGKDPNEYANIRLGLGRDALKFKEEQEALDRIERFRNKTEGDRTSATFMNAIDETLTGLGMKGGIYGDPNSISIPGYGIGTKGFRKYAQSAAGVQLRSNVSALMNAYRHSLFGSALTEGEQRAFEEFAGTGWTANQTALISGLRAMNAAISQKLRPESDGLAADLEKRGIYYYKNLPQDPNAKPKKGGEKAPVGFAGYTDADEKKLQELEAKAKGGK